MAERQEGDMASTDTKAWVGSSASFLGPGRGTRSKLMCVRVPGVSSTRLYLETLQDHGACGRSGPRPPVGGSVGPFATTHHTEQGVKSSTNVAASRVSPGRRPHETGGLVVGKPIGPYAPGGYQRSLQGVAGENI